MFELLAFAIVAILLSITGAMLLTVWAFWALSTERQGPSLDEWSTPEESVPQPARWRYPPRLLIHTPTLPVETALVLRAHSFWKSLEHPFKSVEIITEGPARPVSGAILVAGIGTQDSALPTRIALIPRFPDGVDLGKVKGDVYSALDEIITVYADGEIDHAVVRVPKPKSGRNSNLLITHLLGHALGYVHAQPLDGVPRRGHVMSPLFSQAGWDTSGLTYEPPVKAKARKAP